MSRQPSDSKFKSAERLAFEVYLRTGRRLVIRESSERKFNPYHDPRNGQFTFAPGGPRSVTDPVFSERHGLAKPKTKPPRQGKPGLAAGPFGKVRTSRNSPISADETPANGLKIHLPVAPREVGPLLRISATDDEAEYANCPEGGNCRATVTVNPRDSNDAEIAINEYRRSVAYQGWKDNDFQNLVDMRRTLIAFKAKEAIALRIADWEPTKLLSEEWIAENALDLALDDPDDPIGAAAYYWTLAIDGPGPRPAVLTLENAMNPKGAALAQAEWVKKELLHQSYQALTGGDPIFESTVPVNVSGRRAIDRGNPYEAGVRGLYGGHPSFRSPKYKIVLDGKTVSGRADYITVVDGKETAIDAKFTHPWSKTLRNPSSRIGERDFSVKSQREMIEQARKYEAAYEGGAIYHTNNVEFARFYTNLFHKKGITNFHFVITPSR